MRYYLVILGFMFWFAGTAGQSDTEAADPDQLVIIEQGTEVPETNSPVKIKKFDTDLSVGTSFTYSPHNYFGPSVYIAPSVSWRVNPRFTLQGGAGIERGSYYPLYGSVEREQQMLPMTRAFMFARGSYQLTERLSVAGTAYKVVNDVPRLTHYSRPFNYNYEGVSLGVDYKITPAISVGFHMGFRNQGNYYNDQGLFPPGGYVPVF